MSTNIIPNIILPLDIDRKIQAYVDNCDKEISGLGSVVYDPINNGYRVISVCLLEQEVGAAHTDLDDEAVGKALYEHHVSGKEGELCFWWHSHVNMSTFWSGQDHSTMDSIGKSGLCVAIVYNKKEDKKGAIVMGGKNSPTIKWDDVSILIDYPDNTEIEDVKKEIAEKVKSKSYGMYSGGANPLASSTNVTQSAYDYRIGAYGDVSMLPYTTQIKLDKLPWHKAEAGEFQKIAKEEYKLLAAYHRETFPTYSAFYDECENYYYGSFGSYN